MDKMKYIKNILQSYFFLFLKYSFVNFFLFTFLLSVKRHLQPGILFLEGIVALIISTTLILFLVCKFESTDSRKLHGTYISLISSFIILAFHTTVITIVDRSISIFILGNVKNEVLVTEEIEKNFVDYFTGEAIRKRVKEQTEIGNFELIDGKLIMTEKGEIMFEAFQLISEIFNTDQTILDHMIND